MTEHEPASGWFDLSGPEQAVGAVRAHPFVLLLPAVTIGIGLVLALWADVLVGAIVAVTGLAQLLTPLFVVRRQLGEWSVPRRVSIGADGSIEVRLATGRASRWALSRCRSRVWGRAVHLEVVPGRSITVPRRAFDSSGSWMMFVAAVRASAPSDPGRVEYRSDPWTTRPFDLPLAATVGVVARQQATIVAPLLLLAAGLNVILAPTTLARLAVVAASVVVGTWAVGGAAALRVSALSRHEITKRNVARVHAEGFVLDGPGVSTLRPWSEVTGVRRGRRSLVIRSGRYAMVLPAAAFHDERHVEAFMASLSAVGVPLR